MVSFLFFLKIIVPVIYFWLCWGFIAVRAFSSRGKRGYSLVVEHGLLTAVASLAAVPGL